VNNVGDYDVTVVGVPFDGGCTYRSGTRFGPQGIHRISAIYMPYNYECRIDLRKPMSICELGGVFTIPTNLENSFDHISNAVAHIS
jgi:agmatinase